MVERAVHNEFGSPSCTVERKAEFQEWTRSEIGDGWMMLLEAVCFERYTRGGER